MTSTSSPTCTRRTVSAGALLAIIIVVAAGCSTAGPQTAGSPAAGSTTGVSTTTTAAASTGPPHAGDPDAVLISVAQTVFSYRPGEQIDQRDSFAAAEPNLSPDYAAAVGVSASMLAPITGAQWAAWAAASAVITADAVITAADHPPDTDNRHLRVLTVTQHARDPEGHAVGADPSPLTVYMRAQKPPPTGSDADTAWTVDSISIR